MEEGDLLCFRRDIDLDFSSGDSGSLIVGIFCNGNNDPLELSEPERPQTIVDLIETRAQAVVTASEQIECLTASMFVERTLVQKLYGELAARQRRA